MLNKLKGLYVITDDVLTPKDTMLQQVEKALQGGAKIIQLRDKKNSDEDIEKEVIVLQNLCRSYRALFILNDRVELAMKLQCDGLHVGKSDYHRMKEIRTNFLGYLGVSCYGDIKKAKEMEYLGVDYVAFGSFFASPTKPNAAVVNTNVINEAKNILNIPICAIGGITTKNVSKLIEQKVDMVAVISDIWKSENIILKCEEFKKQLG
eukprot:Anaeramoba_ignava/a91009_100.p4 GENE.a91009_100~~a91009_100.p4  ORF type:complete len:207 (+),score=14.29 a91009_100:557-1177(+)